MRQRLQTIDEASGRLGDKSDAGKPKKKKPKMGMLDSFKFLIQQKYLGSVCVLICVYWVTPSDLSVCRLPRDLSVCRLPSFCVSVAFRSFCAFAAIGECIILGGLEFPSCGDVI